MTDTIRILSTITRVATTPADIVEALGERPPDLLATLEAFERFELIKINRASSSLTAQLTDLGAERVIEAMRG